MSRSNARTLRKVVPIAQVRKTGGITVALSTLELYEGGEGVLRYLISHDPIGAFEGGPEPEVEIRDGPGRSYGWGLEGYSGGDGEEEDTLKVFDLPDSGDIEVRVVRVMRTEPPNRAVRESHEGPWEFRLSLLGAPTEEQSMDERERPPDHWKPAATTLRRVVPVAQKRHASGLTVALTFLEIHEGGNGFVRFLMCQDRPTRRRALTSPGLEIRVRDGSGRHLETREDSSGSSMESSYATLASQATLLIFGLPDSGDVDVEVVRIVELGMFGYPREEGPHLGRSVDVPIPCLIRSWTSRAAVPTASALTLEFRARSPRNLASVGVTRMWSRVDGRGVVRPPRPS